MKKEISKNRRQFLKNTSLAALSVGIITQEAQAKTNKKEVVPTADECDVTTLDLYGQGPFYTEDPPTIEDNQLASVEEEGQRIIITGRVLNLNCEQYIPNTEVDVWHADNAGAYDNEGYNLRGKTYSNDEGFYMFETILPGKYLNGTQFRPAHIHFKITPPGFETLTTQLYFEGDTDIPDDDAASFTSGDYDATHRIIPLTENADGKLEGTWDIVVDGEGIKTGLNGLHINKGVIYEANPSLFSDKLVIKYGVFKEANVSLLVFDMQGLMVATLEEAKLQAEKYEAVWLPESGLPNGPYFIVLKINDLQVHYQKVMRQN